MEELIGYSMLVVVTVLLVITAVILLQSSQYEWQSCMQFDPRGEKS